jgi:adenine-specific DNA-methyltransferase
MPRQKRQPARKTPKAAKPPTRKKTPLKPRATKQSPSSKKSAAVAKTKRPTKAAAKSTARSTKTRSNTATPPTSNRRVQTRKPMNPSNPIQQPDAQTEGSSANIVDQNIDTLRRLFPAAFTESSTQGAPRFKVDFDVLKQLLGSNVEEEPERYSFTWNGKTRARRIAQTPSTGTLRPVPRESVDWETTQNLFVEGDNLEVLKILQKSYHRSVAMIFIDPPYNTGKDFIYPDNYKDNLDTYLRYTQQIDDAGFKVSPNAETSGRYHTNWLSMMLPRLKLARNLLSDDGVIFITIDDTEVANLRKLCDEVFGEENFVALVAWQKKVSPSNDATWFSSDHDHVVVYARSKDQWRPRRLEMNERQTGYYTNPDNDPRGDWNSSTYTCNKTKDERPNLYYPITNPNTGEPVWPKPTAVWAYSRELNERHAAENLIYWGKEGKASTPRLKKFLTDAKGVVPRTVWLYSDVGHTQEATQELRRLVPDSPFETPKPTRLLSHMLRIATAPDRHDLVLDFFAGSCTTADAVLRENQRDGGNRRFILVQLPEAIDHPKYKTIADIGKARLHAVIKEISEEASETPDGELLPHLAAEGADDRGFRVFQLASSNLKPWDADFDTLEQAVYDAVENVKPDRSEQDVLYELLLKFGLDLCVPIEERKIAGKTVFSVGAGALMVCLDKKITLDVVEGIAKLKDELKPEIMRVVFRDSGFKDDVVKTNAVQILKQVGLSDEHIRSI